MALAASSVERQGEDSRQSREEPPRKRTKRKEKERSRVTRACDHCKRKKARCTGTYPCPLCVRLHLSCDYSVNYKRGKLPSIPFHGSEAGIPDIEDDIDNEDSNLFANEQRQLSSTTHQLPQLRGVSSSSTKSRLVVTLPTRDQAVSSRNSPEAPQTDLEGHFVGPSSGVAFLLRAQKRLHETATLSHGSSIFTFGDSPLPQYDPSFLVLPNKSEAKRLVQIFADVAFPTHRWFHRPTIESWLEDFYEKMHEIPLSSGAREKRAVILMVMAQAKQYLPERERSPTDASQIALYFGASEHQLSSETGAIRLTSVQARLAQCFYLLSQSRINHCWSLFGTTVRLAFAIGLHRRRRKEISVGMDLIEAESRKRVFWCAYSLDNYLSAALGRPRSFHDEDIDQDLPQCVNDSELTSSTILPAPTRAQSVMLAPIYHAKLSKIISGVLREMYGIRRLGMQAHLALAQKYSAKLADWRSKISGFLDSPDVPMLITLFQRQHTVLNLAFAHAQILVQRPFLLNNFANLARKSGEQQRDIQEAIDASIAECLAAALSIVGIIHDLCSGGQMYQAFWFTQYYAFCATVVLYVYVIQRHAEPESVWKQYFEAAQQCQRDVSSSGVAGSFAQRYGVVLEELRLEAVDYATKSKDASGTKQFPKKAARVQMTSELSVAQVQPATANSSRPNAFNNNNHNTASEIFEESALLENDIPQTSWEQDFSPSSYVADMTGWGEFDSLVTAGMGDLGNIFPDMGLTQNFDMTENLNEWNFDPHGNIAGMGAP